MLPRSVRPIALLHTVFVLVVASLCGACAPQTPPNVVVIVMDTARPDYLSVYGHERPTSPYLERFARDATRYDRAYSVSNWTLPAHASLFSGTLPEYHGATQTNKKIADAVPTLAERLTQVGYDTAGFSSNPWVAKTSGLARGFRHFREKLNRQHKPGELHPTVKAVNTWFADVRRADAPYFLFVNLIEPHMPYKPTWEAAQPFFASRDEWSAAIQRLYPDGKAAQITNRHYAGTNPLSEDEWRALKSLYEGELRLTDDIVRQLLETVDGASDPAQTLVFVVSDHGENLGDHGHMSHIFNLYDSNVRIVFLARGPGFEKGAVDDRLVQITDVFPTVMNAAEIPTDATCAGVDLFDGLTPDRCLAAWQDYPGVTLDTFPEAIRMSGALDRHKRELFSGIGPRFKVIRGSDASEELYDLTLDPHELSALGAAIDADAMSCLDGALEASRVAQRRAPQDAPIGMDEESLQDMRDLGYAGDDPVDPKER